MRTTRQRQVTATATAVVLLLAGLGMSGCGTLFGKSAPDETQVTDNPSLVLPPNYDLRPPRQAADYESALRNQQNTQTRQLIAGSAGSAAGVSGTGADDAWLTDKAGRVDPNIRSNVDAERAQDRAAIKAEEKESFWHRWFGWLSSDSDD